MNKHRLVRWILFLALLSGFFGPAASAQAAEAPAAQSSDVTAFDLIIAMNTLRTSYGLPALVEDPIIDAVAQSTAEIMAANQMSWHIGDVSGRLASAGYGGGSKVWATENFAVGNMSIDEIMVVWSDASHMIPAVNPAYCNVGAGVAKSPNGMTYYVLQAAYTASKSCGEYKSPGGTTTSQGGTHHRGKGAGGFPVDRAGQDRHPGCRRQNLPHGPGRAVLLGHRRGVSRSPSRTWRSGTTSPRSPSCKSGRVLFIPSSNTAGYATPTPVGMIQVSTPDADGKVVHTVQAYQTLITIAQAYGVKSRDHPGHERHPGGLAAANRAETDHQPGHGDPQRHPAPADARSKSSPRPATASITTSSRAARRCRGSRGYMACR